MYPTSRLVAIFLVAACFAVSAFASPKSQADWDTAVDVLRSERPEFGSFCDTFTGGRLMTWVTDEKKHEVRVMVITSVEQKYSVMLQYEVTYNSDFTAIVAFRDEHRSFTSWADVRRLRNGQALAPRMISREDVRMICIHGTTYLDRLYENAKKQPNQALEPTTTAVTHPADAGCAPAVVVAHL